MHSSGLLRLQSDMSTMLCGPGLGFLPIIQATVSTGTFVTSYIIAVIRNDTVAVFPYISDTGTRSPESNIFGELLTISAIVDFLVMFVRYKLVKELVGPGNRKVNCFNKASLFIGFLSTFGLTLVANFQETVIESIHVTGASLVFGFGVVYSALQTAMSYSMFPDHNGVYVCRWRLGLTIIAFISMVSTFVSGSISRDQWNKATHHSGDRLHWKPEDNGYAAHIISATSEWIMAITFLMFFFTYIRDFQKVNIEVTTHLRVTHLDQLCEADEPNERTKLVA